MRKSFIVAAAGLLAGATTLVASPAAAALGGDWEIGPIIRGKNYSVGMPLRPTPTRTGWTFDFPYASRSAGHVHYVTFDPGSLDRASRIVVRYRVDAAPGTRFVPQESPELPGTVSLFLQRGGDNWSARGAYDLFRWYAPGETVQPLAPGTHEMTVSLRDPQWGSVYGKPAGQNTAAFEDALANASRVGLVFGSTAARGHGVFATAPARFTLLDFRIE
jgi:hypothetical protein